MTLSPSYYAYLVWHYLRKSATAALVSIVALILAALESPTVWASLFTVIVSWVAGDYIVNFFIHGGRGISKTLWSENRIDDKGHAYLAFFLGIIAATFLSGGIADWLVKNSLSIFSTLLPTYTNSTVTVLTYKVNQNWLTSIVSFSSLASVMVFLDLNWRFYKQS